MALNREQRRALARQALEGEEIDVQDVDTQDVKAPVPEAPVGAVTLDANTLAQIVSAAVAQAVAQVGGGGSADAVAQAIRDNRKPIPENTDAEYHGMSHWHPAGKAAPRPELVLETWRASWDHVERKANPREKLDPSQMRDDEIETVNELTPGEYDIERLDGAKTKLYVIDTQDAHGTPHRRLLAFPAQMFQKEHKNQVPDLRNIRRQLLTPVA